MIAQKHKTALRRRLVLASADTAHAVVCARQCRRHGWEVHQTPTGREARRLAGALEPTVVLLDAELPGESGWVTAAKLLLERPHQKILLIGSERTARQEQLALFIGTAGFVTREETSAALEELFGELIPV